MLGLAHDLRRAGQLTAEHRPGVLLLDADLLGHDPVRSLARVRTAAPATRVLLLATEARHRTVVAAILSGVAGLMTNDVCSRQVIDAIHQALAGSPVMTRGTEALKPGRDSGAGRLRLATLSGREREILGLLARARSTRRIADDWQVAESTVRSHIQNLLGKLDAHSKLEAAAFAWEHGIVARTGPVD